MIKNKITISLIIIVILLVGFIVSILVVKPVVERRDDRIFNEGIRFAIGAVMQEVSTCNMIPLTYDNQIINIVAVDCLNTESAEE